MFVMDMRTRVIFWTFDVLIYSFADVNIILVEIIVNFAAQDLNRKCGNEAKRVPNLCANRVIVMGIARNAFMKKNLIECTQA